MINLIRNIKNTTTQPIQLPEVILACFSENLLWREAKPVARKKRIALFMGLWMGSVGVGCVSHGESSYVGNTEKDQRESVEEQDILFDKYKLILKDFLERNNKLDDISCATFGKIQQTLNGQIRDYGADIMCTRNGEKFGVRCYEKTEDTERGCEFIPLPKFITY